MAIREIVKVGDDVLTKKCRLVENFDHKLHLLLDDMADTLKDANGAGLAAPQVGILRRVCIVDIGDEHGLIELVNPEIIKKSGKQHELEGCLSAPHKWGYVDRPKKVTVRAYDRNGEPFEISGEGLLAKAFCHEIDHLDGIMFLSKAEEVFED